MDTITRNVGDLNVPDRQALEHILGRPLFANQQLVIAVIETSTPGTHEKHSANHAAHGEPALPEWCDVYAGLTDQEIAELEQVILRRADFSRYCE